MNNVSIINELCSSLQKKVSNFLIQIVEEQIDSFLTYESKVKELKKSFKELQEKRKMVQLRVEYEMRNGKEIAINVSNWLTEVDKIIADKFWEDKDHPYAKCFYNGFLPKPGIRYRLSRTAYRLAAKVNNLHKTSFSDGVSFGLRPILIDFIFSDIDFEDFDSRKVVTEKITKVLKDSTIRKVGLYGPGGVGKTTLVWKVASKAREDKLFDVVVFANVTRNPDIRKIQGLLADQLGARLDDESEIGRASRLRDIFKKEKRNALVILDDLWTELDLNKLGIPIDDVNLSPSSTEENFKNKMSQEEVTGHGLANKKEGTSVDFQEKNKATSDDVQEENEKIGDVTKKKGVASNSKMFKILLTSRNKEVLSDKMDVKENSSFLIEGLKDKEAEKLFRKEARVANKTLEFGPLATKISKKCGGLPIAIVTIGRTLRNKNYIEWNDTLEQLERKEFIEVVESVEFSTKLSFDHLENEELKSTFLLCAQLGHHPLIMDLVKYCIGLGIFKGFLTIRETRARVFKLIEKLKDSSLLLNSYYIDRFNMHDTIRDVALSIASKERHFFTMRNQELREWPHKNEFKMHSAISIHNCDIYDKLPNFVSCPRLKSFHVDSLDSSFNIPKSFFKGMIELRALILTSTNVSNFSSSIGCLTNLRMLCLERCTLGDISFVEKLVKLRILSLSGSTIENLPAKLDQLHKLQLLDISNCFKLKEIPPNVLASLNNLEELYMRNSVKWESKAILDELSYMHRLKNLDICIPSAEILPENLFVNKLDRYKIAIGDFEMLSVGDFKMPDKDEASRVLALHIKESNPNIHSQKGIKMLFKRVEKLLLGELNGVEDIFYELNLEGFPYLKQLFIVNNSNIECIINSKELQDPKDVFPNLESLCLHKLKKLKKISYSKLTGTSFSKLNVLRITSCDQLKIIFPFFMVKFLSNLETIDVSNCDSLENIVAKEEHDANEKVDVTFPKLRSLALQYLREFSGVYSNGEGGRADICLFNEQVAIPKLESLELYSINMHKIWSNQSKCFENLIKLNVKACGEIKYLFSFFMAMSLKNLKSMAISQCHDMEEIFKYEETTVLEPRKVLVFPMLEEVHLSGMVNLMSIWPNEVSRDSFPSLNSVSVERCHKIDTVLPSHMVGRYCRLESLKIVDCYKVKKIFDFEGAEKSRVGDETHLQVLQIKELPMLTHIWNGDPEGILNFERLHSMDVIGCDLLKYLFPVSVAKSLQELDSLHVFDCRHVEEIVCKEGSDKSSIAFEFPKVTIVVMLQLPELKRFYTGTHSVKWPKLKKLTVISCDQLEVFKTDTTNSEGGPILFPEEIISNLETMEISLEEAKRLQLRIKNFCMNRLNDFALSSCPSDIEILYWFLHRMPSLERLTLIDCNFREVIPWGSHVTQPNIGNVVQLKYLRLWNLSVLKNIGFERDPILRWLEHLYIENCPKLINLAASSVSLSHLTSLDVHKCSGFKNLMGFSIAKSLVQLMSLKVIECPRLEKIVAQQNDEVQITYSRKIVFYKLKTLEFVDLPNLSCFCTSEIHVFEFPSLEKLIMRDCPNMKKFCKQVTTTADLQVLERGENEDNWYWKGDLNATILKMRIQSLPFQYAQSLELYHYAELEEIWNGKIPLPDKSFRNLRTLVVENCEFLLNAIPSHLLSYLENLEELRVRACESVMAIFDVNYNVKVKSRLKKLTLDQLPKMMHVWNKDPQGILSFQNLEIVSVTNCDCLQTLFPAAFFAKTLLELEALEIKHCKELVEIVGKVETSKEGAIEMVEFPVLTTVCLNVLPELKQFYPGRMILRCPQLKFLNVYHCCKLQIFTSKSQSYQGAVVEHQIGTSNDSRPFFSVQEVISHLKELSLNKEEAMMFCNEDIPAHLVSKLKCLRLNCFHNVKEADELPLGILHKLPKLETLVVACSDFNVIFPQTLQLGFAELTLRELRLQILLNLKCIGLEHPCMDPLREKLKKLWVERCPCLTKLVQSPASFSSLERLYISKCDGFECLFNASTARSLLCLQVLRVSECDSIKEIVAQEEDEIGHSNYEIMFSKLYSVFLISLPSLECFYKGSSTLKFPCLRGLNIARCPNIKFFCQGCVDARRMPTGYIPPSGSKVDWRL